MNWSSGKDASLALYHLLRDPGFDVGCLLTSINAHHGRISMHGVRRELLEQQAKSIGLTLKTLELPEQPSMEDYEDILSEGVRCLIAENYSTAVFGDIFLEDLRAYRENQLGQVGILTHFPLWKRDTTELIHEFIDLGFKAVIVCADSEKLGESFIGRKIDLQLLDDLPGDVDPCGENGEFHTFCYDGPIFNVPVSFTYGKRIYREYPSPTDNEKNSGFWFQDLLPV